MAIVSGNAKYLFEIVCSDENINASIFKEIYGQKAFEKYVLPGLLAWNSEKIRILEDEVNASLRSV